MLSAAERNYSHIEKQAITISFGVKKYDMFIINRHFTLYTVLKPFVRLVDFKQATSSTAAARIQRWFLFMSKYNYIVVYKKFINNFDEDALFVFICRQRTRHWKSSLMFKYFRYAISILERSTLNKFELPQYMIRYCHRYLTLRITDGRTFGYQKN